MNLSEILFIYFFFTLLHPMNNSGASVYVTHGGGPMPIIYKEEHGQMYKQFEEIRKRFSHPKAIIIFSAHWQENEWTILDNDNPGLLFDYGGFPPESYKYTYPAKSTPELRKQIEDSLIESGIKLQKLSKNRGYDHGVFIPLMILYPDANIPVIQISLLKSLDPQKHFEMGKALRKLKKDGFLILGSGASVHGGFGRPQSYDLSVEFDKDLAKVCLKDSSQNELLQNLKNWRKLKFATKMHPREEHLIPLFINLGAAEGKEREKFDLHIMGMFLSNYIFK